MKSGLVKSFLSTFNNTSQSSQPAPGRAGHGGAKGVGVGGSGLTFSQKKKVSSVLVKTFALFYSLLFSSVLLVTP